jgi:hypothetical protein
VQLVHWQQQDYTQPAKDIWEVVEGHCSMCLISDLRGNTAGVRDWQVHTTWRYCGVCTRQTNFSLLKYVYNQKVSKKCLRRRREGFGGELLNGLQVQKCGVKDACITWGYSDEQRLPAYDECDLKL